MYNNWKITIMADITANKIVTVYVYTYIWITNKSFITGHFMDDKDNKAVILCHFYTLSRIHLATFQW